MSENEWKVAGRSFRNRYDYLSAVRDQKTAEKLRSETDFSDIAALKKLKHRLEEHDKLLFSTLIGNDFYDEVCESLIRAESALPRGLAGESERHAEKKSNQSHKKGQTVPDSIGKELNEYDTDMQQAILNQMKVQRRKHILLISTLSLLAAVCICYVSYYYFFYQKNSVDYENLSNLKANDSGYKVTLEEEKDKPPILKKYEALYKKNKKLIGWLKIDDTVIDYPVMQTANNTYYLDHNFNQEYDKNGSLFLDKDCNAADPGTNMIIYGHHMKSGKMFGDLNRYTKESYYKEHPQISFDTIYEEGQYDIMYVFRSKIYSEEEIVFKYYQFLQANSADEFNSNMEEMRKLSIYDTGVTASYGDLLLTLSTCDSQEEDGRFVVVAKKVQ